MSAPASSHKRRRNLDSWIARCARALTPLVVAAIIFPGSVCNAEEQHSPPIANAINPDLDLEVSVVATTESPPVSEAATVDAINLDMRSNLPERCLLENTLTLSLVELPSPSIDLIPLLTMPSSGQEMLDKVGALFAAVGSSGADLIFYASRKLASCFGSDYRDLVKRAAMAGLQRVQDEATLARATVMGAASTYNPFRGGKEEGGPQTGLRRTLRPHCMDCGDQTGTAQSLSRCSLWQALSTCFRVGAKRR